MGRFTRARAVALLAACAIVTLAAAAAASATSQGGNTYKQTLLVSDRASSHAPITDSTLQNPWGIAMGPATPLWVVKDNTSLTTLYRGANGVDPVTRLFDVSLVPAPTGIVFNPTNAFLVPGTNTPARFIFDSLSGFISAWTNSTPLPQTDTVAVTPRDHAAYTGLAIAPNAAGGPRLYAADAGDGFVRMFNGSWQQTGSFTDGDLSRQGLVPYGIQVIGQALYVTFAPPPGVQAAIDGAVDVFSLSGRLVKRLAQGGPLAGPWGLALAPPDWGVFGGDLLVGNVDAGTIDAFNPATGHFDGALRGPDGKVLVSDGLWGIAFGNGVIGTPNTLIIAAGVDQYSHGIVAEITPSS